MTDEAPFEDVEGDDRRFRLPKRKWRELLFIGALVPCGGEEEGFERDPSRPIPPFKKGELFPVGARFAIREADGWIYVERVGAD